MGHWGGPGRDVRVDFGSGFLALSLPATLSSWVSDTHTLRLVSEAGGVTGVTRAQAHRAECRSMALVQLCPTPAVKRSYLNMSFEVYSVGKMFISNSPAHPTVYFSAESLHDDNRLFCVFPPHVLIWCVPFEQLRSIWFRAK